MRLSEPNTKTWMKRDPYYPQQKCRSVTLVSGGIRFIRTFVKVPWGGGVKRQWGCWERQIAACLLAIFSDALEMRSASLYGDMQSVIGFSVIPKCVTLNEFDWLFRIEFCFRAGLAGWHRATLENNCVKTNNDRKDRCILSAVKIFSRDPNFWQYKVCAYIRSGSLERRR